ncbi:uncharacterized protein LOC142337314 [Convolutriloba macropyga]|uniref:uncharacterized protein LOC142337314 n=1 Tax=Convolutriloba macropyga TaxID=536237 RepID=UPI003F526870
MSVIEQGQLADIGNLVYNEQRVDADTSDVIHEEYEQSYPPEQEIEVELAIFSKGHGLLSPMQIFEIMFSNTVNDQLPEYPELNGYYVVSSEDNQKFDSWQWSPFSTRNKLYYRCISKCNTIIAIEAFQEEAEDLTEAPKYFINKRDKSVAGSGELIRHYVDAVHVYRLCRKADIHGLNPNFRRHVMWIEAIEPTSQEAPAKKVVEYMWRGKSKPDTLHGGTTYESERRNEEDMTSTPRKKAKLDSGLNALSSPHRSRGALYKVHISNLDPQVNDGDIQELFADFGHMKFHTVHYSQDSASLCSAEVHYDSKQAVESVVRQYNGVPLDGWPLCLAPIHTAGEIPSENPDDDSQLMTKVHVSNLGPEITDDRLSELFTSIGGTKRCVVHHSSSGKSLGTGEVTFESMNQASEAIKKFDHSALEGWPLRLSVIGNVKPVSETTSG